MRLPLSPFSTQHAPQSVVEDIHTPCAFGCPSSAALVAASARFVSKRLALCICHIYLREKATTIIRSNTDPVWIHPPPFFRRPTTRYRPCLKRRYRGGVTSPLHAALHFFPLFRTLYFFARVLPGIPLLLLSMVGLESWFRDKYIVYLSMLCALFLLHTSM